jgi:hypothetical protein
MRRIAVAVFIAAAVGVTSSAAWASPVARTSKTPKLSAMLLTIGQMPTGWSVDNSATSGAGAGCFTSNFEPKGVTQTGSVSVAFAGGGNLPELDEGLKTFSDAKTAYQKILGNLASCKRFSGTVGGQKITSGTAGQMSFPHYGNASQAFAVDFTVDGTTLYEDLLFVLKDNIAMAIDEGDLSSVNLGQFESYVAKAVAKVT